MASLVRDTFGRTFSYLRLSVTDTCNFRCVYCLPNGSVPSNPSGCSALRVSEISNLVSGFAQLGVKKIRLTGGEPTVRKDIVEIAQAVATVPGIRTVGLTTNGYRLKELALPLKKAGVSSLNVSLDSLNAAGFQALTGSSRFDEVVAGVEGALQAGFESVKVNVVLMKGLNDFEVERYLDWAKRTPIHVRWIELMQTTDNEALFEARHMSLAEMQNNLYQRGWRVRARRENEGPALTFEHPDYLGTAGVIAPYSQDFCKSCNRLRVSSKGSLRLCLFARAKSGKNPEKSEEASLREFLESPLQKEELKSRILDLMKYKPASHLLHEKNPGNSRNLAEIGG
ncbi:GTP 3',8-cyclase MoaA [Bdellovibrionota bacterium FG-2]